MNLDRVTSGDNIPNEINVIIEIPAHADPVKNAILLNQFMPATNCDAFLRQAGCTGTIGCPWHFHLLRW